MALKQLKLAGFKSFVDPTAILFPSSLVAIVGPNGCGKSNIIDAVRWVMGEGSAKNLRGDSMTDVIFNGSSNRKPVGQASVELLFDNSLGRLTGPFASYAEISVKRMVNRDGDSFYYLNGNRCRKRDITDIFLGTGAGVRGYSIIGQGTISRLIEAKPEELRVFLEEAAGVSKYKERRRETLQRMEHTREHLVRVADIREELDKQLQRLERQAKSAERYTQLKEEEKISRAQILAFKWQEFNEQQTVKQRELQTLAVRYEQQQSGLTNSHKERTVLNEKLYAANENSQHIQASLYQSGTEIARLEETLQQQEREKRRLEQDRQQMQEDWQRAAEQLKQDTEALAASQHNAGSLETGLKKARLEFQEKTLQGQIIKEEQLQWAAHWTDLQQANSTVKQALQVAQVNLQHLEQKRQQALLRLEKLNLEETAASLAQLKQLNNELQEKQYALQEAQEFDEDTVRQGNETLNDLRKQLQETEHYLYQLQDNYHRLNSDYAALIAAQKAAKKASTPNKIAIPEWSDKLRLMDLLQVEPTWQLACEMVLADTLHAYVLEDLEELWPQWSSCQSAGENIITLRALKENTTLYPRLADKIKGTIPATVPALEHIYTADHLEQARSYLSFCADHESVITASGFWLGKGWAKCLSLAEQDELGLLTRQQRITDLAVKVQELQQNLEAAKIQRAKEHETLQQQVSGLNLLQANVTLSTEAAQSNNNALAANQHAIQYTQSRFELMTAEHGELHSLLEEVIAEQYQRSEQLALLELQSKDYEQQYARYVSEKQERFNREEQHNKELEAARALVHQLEMEYDREGVKAQQLSDRINREQERLSVLQERLEHLALLCLQSITPGTELSEQLAQLLQKHEAVELQLVMSREQLTQFKQESEHLERVILNQDNEVKQLQELIASVKMQEQELSLRGSAVQESLQELGEEVSSVLKEIPLGMSQSQCEEQLLLISEKIKRLGAINLAAIEEFTIEHQRKVYLDEQYHDLLQALEVLEAAIAKLDKETQARLQNTFDAVNTSFKALFPRLFGGGRAQLELTCDNLLEAGIVVMAQPPGKRNSTIHLLSGGEKAMTAVALVFAIFQLNPSPFCMLDEVDAPLDDVNIGRFCALVQEMSQFVQFLFITHNKVTMELADQLIGVTMREPGVSRLVAVDVKEALAME